MTTTAPITQPTPRFELDAYQALSEDVLIHRISQVRERMGSELIILGHHYQRDEVIQQSDLRGDSYKLSKIAAENDACRAIVFCGVHFMAETADILANQPDNLQRRDGQRVKVILPDLAAGCSMADMAAIEQVESAWNELAEVTDTAEMTPITYVNSAASLKAFCGRHGGIVCTSSNAESVLRWAFQQRDRVLFFPDQHLGRNTALRMGITNQQMPVWDPFADDLGGLDEGAIRDSKVILWNGNCSVHQVFQPEHVHQFRKQIPGIQVVVHPECCQQVNDLADESGSTGKIIETIQHAPAGSKWAIGTEWHLVNRLKQQHPDLEIHFLAPIVCMCSTMYRIDLPHLCWSLENLAAGTPVNVIHVDAETAKWSLIALQRMLDVS